MRRRDFITLFAGSAAAWPMVAWAQQAKPVIGFLRSASLTDSTRLVTAFRNGLKETGFIEGQNVAIEYRYSDNQIDRLPALLADLISRPVDVIVVNSGSTANIAKNSTKTLPIIFAGGGAIQSTRASSPASTVRAAMSRGWSSSLVRWGRNGWNCYTS